MASQRRPIRSPRYCLCGASVGFASAELRHSASVRHATLAQIGDVETIRRRTAGARASVWSGHQSAPAQMRTRYAKRFGTPSGCCEETTECARIVAATGFWLSQAAPVRYLNKS
jgi:hypothetical protein